MLHAWFCKCHAGAQTRILEPRKSTKIEFQGAQNPFKNQLQSDDASKVVMEPPVFRKFRIFQWFLDSQMEPKSKKKSLKCDTWKQRIFESIFNAVFFAVASGNGAKFRCFSHLYRKRRFCKNRCFSCGNFLFCWFGASKNHLKINAKTTSKKTLKKIAQKSSFGLHVGLQNPLKSLRKVTLNEAWLATPWTPPGSRQK